MCRSSGWEAICWSSILSDSGPTPTAYIRTPSSFAIVAGVATSSWALKYFCLQSVTTFRTKKWSQFNLNSRDLRTVWIVILFSKILNNFTPGRISFFKVLFLQAILKSKNFEFSKTFFFSRYSAWSKIFPNFLKNFWWPNIEIVHVTFRQLGQ